MRTKATWIGDGEPESGVYEYGYGTDHPDIPRGVNSQQNKPDSNWEFSYEPDIDVKSFKIGKFLNTPVWFYNAGDRVFYTPHKSVIPANATNIEEGVYQDVYRLAATKITDPAQKDPLADADGDKLAKQRKILETLARTGVKVAKSPRGVSISTDLNSPDNLLGLYLYAIQTNNSTLANNLERWSNNPKAVLQLTGDALVYNHDELEKVMMKTDITPFVTKIIQANTSKKLRSAMAYVFSYAQGHLAEDDTPVPVPPVVKPAFESKPLPEVLTKDDVELKVAPIDRPSTPIETSANKVEFLAEQFKDTGVPTKFASKYSALGVETGGQYLARIPDGIMVTALGALSAKHREVLKNLLPGVFRAKGFDGPAEIVPQVRRHFSTGGYLTSPEIQRLVDSLMFLEAELEKLNPELTLTNDRGTYSPVISMDFPYMGALSSQSEQVFSAMQAAFFVSLVNEMKKSDLETGQDTYSAIIAGASGPESPEIVKKIELTKIDKTLIRNALSNLWNYKESDGKPTSLAIALEIIQMQTGDTEAQVIKKIGSVLEDNLTNLDKLNSKKGSSLAILPDGSSIKFAGRALGIATAAQYEGTKHLKLNDARNTLMQVAQRQFAPTLEKLLGERVEIGLGDNITYQPSNPEAKPIEISLGLWQSLHNFLPYHINNDGDLIVEVLGESHNLDKLKGAERGRVLDGIMSRIKEVSTAEGGASLGSDELIISSIRKYQAGLQATYPKEFEELAGSEKEFLKLDAADDVHADNATLDQISEVVSSLTNYVFSDVKAWFAGEMPTNLPDYVMSDFADDPVRLYENAFSMKQNDVYDAMPIILEKLGIEETNHAVVSDMINNAFDAVRKEMVERMQTKFARDKDTKLQIQLMGNIAEHLQILAPALSVIRYAQRTGQTVSVIPERPGSGAYSYNLNSDLISGKGETKADKDNRNWSNFLRMRTSMSGFHLKIGDVDHFIIKESRTSGAGDISHIIDPSGDAIAYSFEGKLNIRNENQKPHIAQIAPMLKNIMATCRNSKTIRVGKTRTINSQYDGPGRETPTGSLNYGTAASCTLPRFGMYKIGQALNLKAAATGFSAYDGSGLANTGYE